MLLGQDYSQLEECIWGKRAEELSEELGRPISKEEAVQIYNERIKNTKSLEEAIKCLR